jgi:Zn-dependent protease with chaperone function
MRQIYPFFKFTNQLGEDSPDGQSVRARAAAIFSGLLFSAKLSGISLSIVPDAGNLPPSAAMDWKGEKSVSITSKTVLTLDDDELRAVLAHELGHLVHRDSLRKMAATVYRTAFIFDPVAHFVEAAIYRDGELYADEYSARLTGKPAALASALIKLHESMRTPLTAVPTVQGASLLMNERESGIFSKQPSLTVRIKKLLEMEDDISSGEVLEKQDKEATA